MRWITNLAVVIVLALTAQTWAAGLDDQYLDIYNQILQAESSLQSGHSSVAAQQFLEARSALQKLHEAHPGWNPEVVTYRLQYLTDQLKALGKSAPVAASPALPAAAPALASGDNAAELRQVIATLQQQKSSLAAANAQLQNKLYEALSVQPAAVDPAELAKAEDKIIQLQKQRDLLAASLEQGKAVRDKAETARPSAPEGQNAKLKQLAKERDQFSRQRDQALKDRDEALKDRDQLAKERNELKKDLAARSTELAEAQSRQKEEQRADRADSRKLKQVEQERDELQKKVALLTQRPPERPSDSAAPHNDPLLLQIDQLRAQVAVLEAKPVPYSAEELALLKQGQTSTPAPIPVASSAEPKRKIHSVKDLPPGAGALMAQAQRAAMERDYEQAEQKYNEVLRQDENNVFVLDNLASAQFDAGQLDQCEKNVRRALSLDPDDSASLYLLGILRYRQEKLDESLEALSRSATLNPTNAATQNFLGCVLCAKGLRQPAEAALRKALALKPDYVDAHYSLGLVYATETPPSLALARWHYQKALDGGHPRNSKLEKLLGSEDNAAH